MCDKSILLWILGIAVVILIAVGVWLIFAAPKPEGFRASSQQRSNFTATASNNGKGELIYFYGDWCPHCKTFMPVWDQLQPQLQSMGVSARKISDKDPIVKSANVPGFPCVRWYPRGLDVKDNYIQFSGQRDVQSLVDFVKKNR